MNNKKIAASGGKEAAKNEKHIGAISNQRKRCYEAFDMNLTALKMKITFRL